MRTRLLTGLAAATGLVALAACSTADGTVEPSTTTTATTQTVPEASPDVSQNDAVDETGAALRPGEKVPQGMDVHDVTVFQVAIPAAWTPDPPGDQPTLAFWGEDEDGAPAEGAVVAWDPQATSASGAAEEFVRQLEADGRAATLEPLSWPDVPQDGAFLVTFDDELAPGAERHGQQIFAELPQGGIATVLAFAVPEAFESSPVPEVLGSFRVAP